MKKNNEPKEQLCVYVPKYIAAELRRTATMRRTTISAIATAAFKETLENSEGDSVIDKRLNRLQRQYERTHREQQILTETLASFVKVYLAHTPIISDEQKADAERYGAERFEKFLGIIRRAFTENHTFVEMVEEKEFTEEDFKESVQ